MGALSDFHLELSEWNDGEQAIRSCSDGCKMLLTSAEFSSAHLANHAADAKRFHVRILKGYESTTVDDDTQIVYVVILLAELVTPCATKEPE